MVALAGPLSVSSLLLLEFRQSTRLQIRLHLENKSKGFGKAAGTQMLRHLQSDLAEKVLDIIPVDWTSVHQKAEHLSATWTETNGHRFADILQVATALQLGVRQFLTFDANQKRLAAAEGLEVL